MDGIGVLSLMNATGNMTMGVTSGENNYYIKAIADFTFSFGIFSNLYADYISKSSVDEPPKKPKKKPVLERIKEQIGTLLPQPILQPIPVQSYSTLNSYVSSPAQ